MTLRRRTRRILKRYGITTSLPPHTYSLSLISLFLSFRILRKGCLKRSAEYSVKLTDLSGILTSTTQSCASPPSIACPRNRPIFAQIPTVFTCRGPLPSPSQLRILFKTQARHSTFLFGRWRYEMKSSKVTAYTRLLWKYIARYDLIFLLASTARVNELPLFGCLFEIAV